MKQADSVAARFMQPRVKLSPFYGIWCWWKMWGLHGLLLLREGWIARVLSRRLRAGSHSKRPQPESENKCLFKAVFLPENHFSVQEITVHYFQPWITLCSFFTTNYEIWLINWKRLSKAFCAALCSFCKHECLSDSIINFASLWCFRLCRRVSAFVPNQWPKNVETISLIWQEESWKTQR